MQEPWLRPDEAAKYLGVSVATLAQWRWRGTGPKYCKLGDSPRAHTRYRREDLDAWASKTNGRAVSL